MVPRPEMEKELKTQEKELTDDLNSLNKKVSPPSSWYRVIPDRDLKAKYLEKQFSDAQGQRECCAHV